MHYHNHCIYAIPYDPNTPWYMYLLGAYIGICIMVAFFRSVYVILEDPPFVLNLGVIFFFPAYILSWLLRMFLDITFYGFIAIFKVLAKPIKIFKRDKDKYV